MNGYVVTGATLAGRDHAAVRRGTQDALVCGTIRDAAFGVVCDGCGEGARSEVGAGLAAAYLGAELERLVGSDIAIGEIPELAVARLVALLDTLARTVAGDEPERASGFVRQHLLSTVVAFCVRGDEGVVFWCGDGLVALDDEVLVLDQENRPAYPAYAVLGVERPAVAMKCFRTRDVQRIAIATDGFDPELVDAAFGRRGRALGRWMHVCARAGHFRDDASVVLAERIEREQQHDHVPVREL